MRTKHAILVFFSLFLFVTTVSSQGAITDDFQSQSPTDILAEIPKFLADMLHFPDPVKAFTFAIWLGGMAFTIFGFRVAVQRFDSKLGGWIRGANVLGSTNRDYWFISAALALMFIGGTNFAGWVNDLVSMLVVGGLLLVIGLAIRLFWETGSIAGGQALNVSHQARNGTLGAAGAAAVDGIRDYWVNNRGSNAVTDAWDAYRNIKICDNDGHLNPGSTVGDNCWTGCGGNVINR